MIHRPVSAIKVCLYMAISAYYVAEEAANALQRHTGAPGHRFILRDQNVPLPGNTTAHHTVLRVYSGFSLQYLMPSGSGLTNPSMTCAR